jgi:[NiFe] hydrogenase assembly HybE family chaperone
MARIPIMSTIAESLAACFGRIQAERMQGLPILNPNLCVQVVGAREFGGDWVGVLITPWCMNLVVVPAPGSDNRPGSIGSKRDVRFPSGAIEFIASDEDGIGPFAACSLFSPMGDFPDQFTAIVTAESVMNALFDRWGDATMGNQSASADGVVPVRGVSRRDFLRGLRRPAD